MGEEAKRVPATSRDFSQTMYQKVGMLKVAWDRRTCLQAHSHVCWQGNTVPYGYFTRVSSSSCQALYKVSLKTWQFASSRERERKERSQDGNNGLL